MKRKGLILVCMVAVALVLGACNQTQAVATWDSAVWDSSVWQ